MRKTSGSWWPSRRRSGKRPGRSEAVVWRSRRLAVVGLIVAMVTILGGTGASGTAGVPASAAVVHLQAAGPPPPAPPGGRIYGPFPSLAACARVLQKTQPPPGWQKACFRGDDGNWYIAVWPPQEEHQPTITLQPWHYLISLTVNLIMQGDGNLVLYNNTTGQPLWATSTVGKGALADMQGDGNFVVYNSANRPVWASNTCCRTDAWLQVQDDGNVVIYNGGHPIWATNTAGQ